MTRGAFQIAEEEFGHEWMRAPFPAFGGKSRVAGMVWSRIGDVDNWIEPFCFSAAATLLRPASHVPRMETINDACAFVSNFWRATARDPDAVAEFCNWPVNEADLEARHKWLVTAARKREHAERMRDDPDYYDAKIAGWWCWGLAQWIGGGWCAGEWNGRGDDDSRGRGTHGGDCAKRPHLGHAGMGVHRKLPHLGDAGRGVHRQRPHLGHAGRGEEARRGDVLRQWFQALRDRLRNVRVACGDWRRVCDSDATTLSSSSTCGVFLDPPYSKTTDDGRKNRDGDIYINDRDQDVCALVRDVREWCAKWGAVPGMRIALCGYEGEGHEELESLGWTVEAWKAQGGYANTHKTGGDGRNNRHRERIWFSPECEKEAMLWE